MKVAALVPYHTDFCAGQRFRIELWMRHLGERGIEVEYLPFASPALTSVLYTSGRKFHKGRLMLECYFEQLQRVMRAARPDVVYIYREAALLGPAFIERLTRRWKAPIVYDIDEPIFIPYVSPRNGYFNRLKFFSKAHFLFEMSDHVLAVNQVIAHYAARYARRVSIIPMAVDTERYQPSLDAEPQDVTRIAWVGTLTNQPNLELVAEPLRRLRATHPSQLRVIADEPLSLPGVEVEFIPWAYDIEVPRLQQCQIGIVPVKPSVWSAWKFFFKLIQFMSLGIPVVATPTGSNLEIIKDGVNGFLADSADEWYERLRLLTEDANLRRSMGEAARETAKNHFGLAKQLETIENIFRDPLDYISNGVNHAPAL